MRDLLHATEEIGSEQQNERDAMLTLEERLQRCELDLALSYECLALEQEGARKTERELATARRELAFARRQFSHSQRDLRVALRQLEAGQAHRGALEEQWQATLQRCRELEFENELLALELTESGTRADSLEENLYLSEERRLDEQDERVRLGRRLAAAQERVRELEAMQCDPTPISLEQLLGSKPRVGSPVSSASVGRTQVEGWMASWSMS